MSEQLPLNALRAFEAAARLLSFRRAADELHVTPAAVSQQIKTLEDLLDVRLFHRLHRGLALTAAGESGLVAIQEGFARLGDGVRMLKGVEGARSLHVWMAPSFAAKWLMPRLDRFVAAHPDIELSINASAELIDSATSRVELTEELMQTEGIDVAIRFGRGNYPGCRVEKLMSAVVLPLCAPELLTIKGKPLRRPEDLVHHTLLHDDTPYEGRPDWASWFEAAGVSGIEPRRGIRFNSVLLALSAAIDQQGVVLSIKELAADDMAHGRLVCPFSPVVELQNAYYVISREQMSDEPEVAAFRAWVLEEAGQAVGSASA